MDVPPDRPTNPRRVSLAAITAVTIGVTAAFLRRWLLVDFLTQERIGVIQTRKKPRITIKRFLNWLDDQVVELL